MNRPPKEVLPALAALDPKRFLKRNGSVNGNAIARETGVRQGTISKLLNGDPEHQRFSNQTVEKLYAVFCRYGVTPSQIRGEEPLEGEDSAMETSADEGLVEKIERLPENARQLIEAHVDLLLDKAPSRQDLDETGTWRLARRVDSGRPRKKGAK